MLWTHNLVAHIPKRKSSVTCSPSCKRGSSRAFLTLASKPPCPSASAHAAPFSRGDKNPLSPSCLTTGCLGQSWRLAGFPFYITVRSGKEGKKLLTSTKAKVGVQLGQTRLFSLGRGGRCFFCFFFFNAVRH